MISWPYGREDFRRADIIGCVAECRHAGNTLVQNYRHRLLSVVTLVYTWMLISLRVMEYKRLSWTAPEDGICPILMILTYPPILDIAWYVNASTEW